MKRLFVLLIVLVLALAVGVCAQTEKKAHFGITGGASMGNFSGSDADPGSGVSKKMRIGFAAGGFVEFDLSPSFALCPEAMFVQKGAKYEASGVSATTKIDYIEIPVLFKWLPVMEGKMQPTIFAGPYLGLRMTAKAADTDIKDQVKSTDFGATFGAGFGSKMTDGELFFDVRLDLGLSKIDNGTPQANIKNTAFLVLIGYKFGK